MTPSNDPSPSLAAIRERIDGIDAALVELIAERQRWVVAAGTHKTDDESVRTPARVEQVIAKVRGLAVKTGASPEVVEHTYRAMISAFINLELAEVTARTRAD